MAHGSWSYKVDVPGESGARRQSGKGGFATKREAEQALAELLAKAARGPVVAVSRQRLGEYLSGWLELVRPTLSPAAWTNYRTCLDRSVQPWLSGVPLGQLTGAALTRTTPCSSTCDVNVLQVKHLNKFCKPVPTSARFRGSGLSTGTGTGISLGRGCPASADPSPACSAWSLAVRGVQGDLDQSRGLDSSRCSNVSGRSRLSCRAQRRLGQRTPARTPPAGPGSRVRVAPRVLADTQGRLAA